MADNTKRVLFVSSEMTPYLGDSDISVYCRNLAQGIQDRKIEIRTFMPRYGLINERKNQLHEVIRLSGMNLIISDVDRPLIIKVASLPSARMQVYFIDNEDYFRRKALFTDAEGKYFKDNGERAIFFARGVFETVKKLRWSPDVIHCSGGIAQILPLYLKKYYKDDPIFTNSKVVTTLFDGVPSTEVSADFADAVLYNGGDKEAVAEIQGAPTGTNLAKLALRYSDGVAVRGSNVPSELIDYAKSLNIPCIMHRSDDPEQWAAYQDFYNNL